MLDETERKRRACEKTVRWQAKNRQKVREIAKANYLRNRERYLAERKVKRALEAEARRTAQRERYASDPAYRAKVQARVRAAYQARKDRVKAYQRTYRTRNGEKVAALAATARARKAQAPGRTTAAQWADILDYFGHSCAYCLRHEAEVGKLTRDHLQALTRGGTNWPDNLVPACRRCNCSKKSSTLFELVQRRWPPALAA